MYLKGDAWDFVAQQLGDVLVACQAQNDWSFCIHKDQGYEKVELRTLTVPATPTTRKGCMQLPFGNSGVNAFTVLLHALVDAALDSLGV